MKKYLVKLADHLDKKGLHKEANYVDWILKNASEFDYYTDKSGTPLCDHKTGMYKWSKGKWGLICTQEAIAADECSHLLPQKRIPTTLESLKEKNPGLTACTTR